MDNTYINVTDKSSDKNRTSQSIDKRANTISIELPSKYTIKLIERMYGSLILIYAKLIF